ncbi:MAG: metal ABC transporter ATP-binding protein [bacterium]|nr:metal ABC transporter ATP-binding protein [bacterium]
MPLIKCDNVTMSYEGKKVLENISFEVNSGDYLCIVGENGSGKSTLLKGILGIKCPTFGSIVILDGLQRNEIGYLPQQTVVQRDFPAKVWEIVLSGCLNRSKFIPFYSKSDKARALENIERLNIRDLKNCCYSELSVGQQQRVLLARALCATGRLILLDEPVAGLDPVVTNELYELLSNLNTKHSITVVMVSHDIKQAVNYATHILHLGNNSTFFGKREDYLFSKQGENFIKQM